MKSKITVVALALLLSVPAFAKQGGTCPSYLCGSTAIGSPAAPWQSAAYTPGPTAWAFVLQMFGL